MIDKLTIFLKSSVKMLVFALMVVPSCVLVRALGVFLFGVEAVVMFIPCVAVEILTGRMESPFHWIADRIGELSDFLIEHSSLDRYRNLFFK